MDMKVICYSEEETIALGESLGRSLKKNSIVSLFGDLGAGKTTFVKGVVSGATGLEGAAVNSPTFVYLNIYEGSIQKDSIPVYHFDLYRLSGEEEFLSMGFDEYLFGDGIACIEWSERIAALLPDECIVVEIRPISPDEREITIQGGKDGQLSI